MASPSTRESPAPPPPAPAGPTSSPWAGAGVARGKRRGARGRAWGAPRRRSLRGSRAEEDLLSAERAVVEENRRALRLHAFPCRHPQCAELPRLEAVAVVL